MTTCAGARNYGVVDLLFLVPKGRCLVLVKHIREVTYTAASTNEFMSI